MGNWAHQFHENVIEWFLSLCSTCTTFRIGMGKDSREGASAHVAVMRCVAVQQISSSVSSGTYVLCSAGGMGVIGKCEPNRNEQEIVRTAWMWLESTFIPFSCRVRDFGVFFVVVGVMRSSSVFTFLGFRGVEVAQKINYLTGPFWKESV